MQTPTISDIDFNEVELRAYELWVAAGSPIGSDYEFWIEAEAELRATDPHTRTED